jgi:hypothetical protein
LVQSAVSRKIRVKCVGLNFSAQGMPILHHTHVIKGEFEKPGQTDWAVLCSVRRVSSILIFWNGSTEAPTSLAEMKEVLEWRMGVKRAERVFRDLKRLMVECFGSRGSAAPPQRAVTKKPPIDKLGNRKLSTCDDSRQHWNACRREILRGLSQARIARFAGLHDQYNTVGDRP